MQASLAIQKFIKNEEGCRLTSYLDEGKNGYPTIGYGHKLAPGSRLTVISQNTADYLFQADLGRVESYLNLVIKEPLSQYQFDALCSLIYNIGEQVFQKSSVLAYVKRGDMINAARWMLDYCRDAHNNVLPDLVKRRIKESVIFLNLEVNYGN